MEVYMVYIAQFTRRKMLKVTKITMNSLRQTFSMTTSELPTSLWKKSPNIQQKFLDFPKLP